MKLIHKSFGEGEPMIILHGLMGMLDNWQAPAKMLMDDFHTIIVDQRNHGRSPHADEMNYDLMMDDVLELMDDLGLTQAHVLGHSMGGKVAMNLAQQHPNRVQKLIVADIGPKFYPVHHEKILAGLRAVPLSEISRRGEAEPFLETHIPEAGVRQFLMKSLYLTSEKQWDWRFNLNAIDAQISGVGQALEEDEFEGETLFMRGGASNYILDEDWADIKLLFPNAYLHTIDGAGHWLHAEQPEAFVTAVKEFLTS